MLTKTAGRDDDYAFNTPTSSAGPTRDVLQHLLVRSERCDDLQLRRRRQRNGELRRRLLQLQHQKSDDSITHGGTTLSGLSTPAKSEQPDIGWFNDFRQQHIRDRVSTTRLEHVLPLRQPRRCPR